MVTGLNQRENCRSNGTHSRRKNDAFFGAFEVGKAFLRDFGGGVAVSAIFEMFLAFFGEIFDVLAVSKRESRGLNDRGGY